MVKLAAKCILAGESENLRANTVSGVQRLHKLLRAFVRVNCLPLSLSLSQRRVNAITDTVNSIRHGIIIFQSTLAAAGFLPSLLYSETTVTNWSCTQEEQTGF